MNSSESSPIEGATSPATILLCEDEPLVRHVAHRTLADAGYHVILAENGQQALKLVNGTQEPIHLLISDVVMPEMSGRDLRAQLAISHPHIRTLLMSGYTFDALGADSRDSDGVEFMQKPFRPVELVDRVREILALPS